MWRYDSRHWHLLYVQRNNGMSHESIKRIAPTMPGHLAGPIAPTVHSNIHSDVHDFIDCTRTEFGETAKIGPGSFGYYLERCKGFSAPQLEMIKGSMKDAVGIRSKGKMFLWLVKAAKMKGRMH